MDLQNWPYRLKSARRKKRLVRKDRDKQLIQLDKQHSLLCKEKQHLPMIPLEHPYQKGWKKIFVLHKDVQQSEKVVFYQGILDKINTVEYHYDKSFKKRKRRKQRYHYEEKIQALREICNYDWYKNKLKLSEAEQACFSRKEEWLPASKMIRVTYAFTESWRFVLAVKPHIIYEVKMVDELLEQELKAIDNRIGNQYLWPKIHRLTNGRSCRYWADILFEKPKYINKLKNKPRYTNKEAYLD
ncbi:hypothetical protein [Mucilaginibacter sp. OK098]|uniref:hypothetical protein n=1 Tax=Mucilaginibacter sp. OK098 TaxID=1855297 RepID=UPI000918EB1E|nr:hypothetical protein [Mucilaginibacter sp. OK098]SHM52724.1 hypothetical protein SAMN05216524_102403 [Mucilaginibacter sp. OK098]